MPIYNHVMGGGVEVLTFDGTYTTSNGGSMTISCGFRPDLLIFYTTSGHGYECVGSLPIAERRTNATLNTMAWSPASDAFLDFDLTGVSDTGASVRVTVYSTDVYGAPYGRRNIRCRAVKYTD